MMPLHAEQREVFFLMCVCVRVRFCLCAESVIVWMSGMRHA